MLAVELAVATELATPLRGGGELRWSAPASCPDAAAVAALVDEHLREQAEPAPVRVDATASERGPDDWVAEVRISAADDATSTRTFEVGSCEAAAEAVALATALAASPISLTTGDPPTEDTPVDDAARDPVPAPPEPAPLPDPAPTPAEAEPASDADDDPASASTPTTPPGDATTPDRANRPRPRGFLTAAGGVTGGILPRPTGLLVVESGLLGRRWHVWVRGDYAVARRVQAPLAPNAGGDVSMFGGGLGGGPVFAFEAGPARFDVPVSASVFAGVIRAAGFGTDHDSTETVPWVAVTASAGLRWIALPWLAVGVRAELPVALLRHTFTLGGPLVVARTGIVGGRGLLTLQFRFPDRKR